MCFAFALADNSLLALSGPPPPGRHGEIGGGRRDRPSARRPATVSAPIVGCLRTRLPVVGHPGLPRAGGGPAHPHGERLWPGAGERAGVTTPANSIIGAGL